MHALEAHEIANTRTVGTNPDQCVPDNGWTAGGTRGRGHVELVPRGYGRVLALAMGAPVRPEKGRPMRRKRLKQELIPPRRRP
jgi:hypothetical protein